MIGDRSSVENGEAVTAKQSTKTQYGELRKMDASVHTFDSKHSDSRQPAEMFSAEQASNLFADRIADSMARPAEDTPSVLFDPNVPLYHFEQIAQGVYRSGRPNGEEGVKEAVEKIWNNSTFDPEQAKHTTIIDLRGTLTGKNAAPNENAVHQEAQIEESLGITNARFGMDTHNYIDHTFIQSALDYIDQQKADGQRVLIHCYRGIDRTGTIAAAYELTHDPQLEQLVKNNPDQAYKAGLKSMTDNGYVQSNLPELAKSLRDFVNWKHREMVNNSGNQQAEATSYLDLASIWKSKDYN